MTLLTNKRGSALLESAIVSGALALIVSGGLITIYFAFTRVWLERSVYEAAICLASTETKNICERDLRFKIGHALPIGEIKRLQMSKSSSISRVSLEYSFIEDHLLKEDIQLRLPLSALSRTLKAKR